MRRRLRITYYYYYIFIIHEIATADSSNPRRPTTVHQSVAEVYNVRTNFKVSLRHGHFIHTGMHSAKFSYPAFPSIKAK